MKKLLVANWKSNKNREQAQKWMEELRDLLKPLQATNSLSTAIVICPPFPSLMLVSDAVNQIKSDNVFTGVQDISLFPAGSYTGAVSTVNLEGFDVKYAIVGHSERRKYFHESSLDVAKKVEQCLEAEITPIVCMDREQILEQMEAIDKDLRSKIIVAYEPVEYIGSGEAQEVSAIKPVIDEIKNAFDDVAVLYGGSVHPGNVNELKQLEELSGFLVGSASLDAKKFFELI